MKDERTNSMDSREGKTGGLGFLRDIARGYGRLLKSLGLAIVVITISFGLTAGISYPLWYLSIHHKRIYAIGMLCAFSLAFLAFVFGKLRASLRSGMSASELSRRALRHCVRILASILILLLAVPVFILFARGNSFAGILALIPYVLIAGAFFFKKRKSQRIFPPIPGKSADSP
jgi:hypothetical protein